MTRDEQAHLNVIERRVDVMQRDIEHAIAKMEEIDARQRDMHAKVDLLVDRVADVRLENYKSGLIAAVVAGAIQALGWKANQ